MKSKIIWLRLSYWTAAIADFGIGISVLIPEKVGLTKFVYPMGLMSSVAISWGILLLIADRKPLERRWILLPTIIVVALINGVRLYSSMKQIIEFSLPLLFIGILILILLIYSYATTRDAASEN